jgi:hypothetical protein
MAVPSSFAQTTRNARLPAGGEDFTELARSSKKMHSLGEDNYCLAKTTDKLFRGAYYTYDKASNLAADAIMVLLMLVSLFILFLGAKIAISSLFLIVASAGFYLTFAILTATTDACTMPLVLATGAGLICGLIAVCMWKPAFVIVGAATGMMIAYEILASVGVFAGGISDSGMRILYWISVVIAALIGAWFGFHYAEDALALVTSLLGAYGFEIGLRGFLEVFSAFQMSDMASLITLFSAFIFGFAFQLSSVHSKD